MIPPLVIGKPGSETHEDCPMVNKVAAARAHRIAWLRCFRCRFGLQKLGQLCKSLAGSGVPTPLP